MKSPSISTFLLLSSVVGSLAFTTPIQKRATLSRSTIQWVETADTTKEVTTTSSSTTTDVATTEKPEEEEQSEIQKLFQQVKDSGTAGAISLGLWEGAFWLVSIPVAVLGFQQVTGHLPDFSNQDDMGKLGAEAFAFVNFARFAVPLRVGLALATVPWVQENIVEKFMKGEEEETEEEPLEVVMDFSAEGNGETALGAETKVEEEETPEQKRGVFGRLVPPFLRKD